MTGATPVALFLCTIEVEKNAMKKMLQIQNQSRALPMPLKAVYCASFLCRLKGLMFRKTLPSQEGLLLVYGTDSRLDTSIHMMFVWFDLAVIWINSAGEVVDTILAKQWKPAYFPQKPARYVLEIAPERLSEFQIGDRILLET